MVQTGWSTRLTHEFRGVLCFVVALTVLLTTSTSFAQMPGGMGGDPSMGPPGGPPGGPGGPGGNNSSSGGTAQPPPPPPPLPPLPANIDDPATCRGPRVGSIRFVGLQRVEQRDLQNSLRTAVGRCFSRQVASRDAHSLWDLGFFSDVQVASEPTDEGNVEVRFLVTERPSVHAIRVVGNDAVEEDKIREQIEIREGSALSEGAIRRTTTKIRELYAERGYFLAEVRGEVERVQGSDNEADIVFRIRENAQVQIRSINFVGNDNIGSDELRGVMQSGTAGFFSFLTSTGNYREEAFRSDIDLLHAAYYDRGFLNVEIDTPRVALSPDRRFLDITLYVREGPRYRVGQFRVYEVDEDGNEIEPLNGRRRVREMFRINPGENFSRTAIGRDLVRLQTHYRDAGYASVEVTPDIQPRVGQQTVDLSLRIRRGPMTYVHRIVITGNNKTSDRVIRREMPLFEGQRYSESLYQESRRRIMQLGFFERAELSTEQVEGRPDRIIVNVEVTERPTGTFQVGAGVSSVELFIITAQIQQLNLFGRGQSFSLQAQLSPLRQIFAMRFVEPYLFDTNWTGALDVYNTLRAYANFSRESRGGSISLGYPLIGVNDLRLSASYTGEYVGTNRSANVALLSGVPTSQGSGSTTAQLANIFRSGFTSALGLSLTLDTRDNRMMPTAGLYARVGVEVADNYTGSQYQYIRSTGFFRFYVPLPLGMVLKGNLNGGFIFSRDPQGVPITERYFLGGILDIRGYRLRTIGPRISIPSAGDPNAALVDFNIGGNAMAYYNLEFEFPIVERLGVRGVVFHDGGNTFNTEQQFCLPGGTTIAELSPCGAASFALRYSVGIGFRWFSPLGLLRFEWGFPINRLPFEEPSVFEFTIGNMF